MTKIIFISHSLTLGGTEKALLALMNSFNLQKIAVTVLLLEDGGELRDEISAGVKVEILPNFNRMKPIIFDPPRKLVKDNLRQKEYFQAIDNLVRYAKVKLTNSWYYNYIYALKKYPVQYEADVAVAFAGPSDFISYLVLNNIKAKKKIQWIHFDVKNIVTNFNFGRKFYPYFDKIFCVSKSARNIFVKHFPQFESKTEVFPNIVPREEITAKADQGPTFNDGFQGTKILTVGRFTHEKGQHLIPQAVKRLKNENYNFRWYFVGDGKERLRVEKQFADLGLSDYVLFLGEQINPYAFMRDCDMYVQPSLHEGFGITVAEAQVFNKPIVVTRFASAQDLIEHESTGLIVDISEEGLYQGVRKLLEDEELCRKFSRRVTTPETSEGLIQDLFS